MKDKALIKLKEGQVYIDPEGDTYTIHALDRGRVLATLDRIDDTPRFFGIEYFMGHLIRYGFVLSKKHIIQQFFEQNAPNH